MLDSHSAAPFRKFSAPLAPLHVAARVAVGATIAITLLVVWREDADGAQAATREAARHVTLDPVLIEGKREHADAASVASSRRAHDGSVKLTGQRD